MSSVLYNAGGRASVVVLMPPMPRLVCLQSAQRAAAWGNQRSSLWATHETTTKPLLRRSYWKQLNRSHHYVWRSCCDWPRTLKSPGKQCYGSIASTSRCHHTFCQKAPKKGSCHCWNMPRKCLSALTSLCASRRIAMIEHCWWGLSCSWALQHCHQVTSWFQATQTRATYTCCTPSNSLPHKWEQILFLPLLTMNAANTKQHVLQYSCIIVSLSLHH